MSSASSTIGTWEEVTSPLSRRWLAVRSAWIAVSLVLVAVDATVRSILG